MRRIPAEEVQLKKTFYQHLSGNKSHNSALASLWRMNHRRCLALSLPRCLIAVFMLSAWPRLGGPALSPHMFPIVWIQVKQISGHYADWKRSTPLDFTVILNLRLLGHDCCVFCVSLCFLGTNRVNKSGRRCLAHTWAVSRLILLYLILYVSFCERLCGSSARSRSPRVLPLLTL